MARRCVFAPAAALSFTRTPQGWTQGPAAAAARQGPIVEAVNARHIYVYGAGDPQTRRYAETAAAWSSKRTRLNLTLPVKSDREVNDDDLAGANLVLFGTPQTNRLIARFAPQFPIALIRAPPITDCSSFCRPADTTSWSVPACPGGPARKKPIAAATSWRRSLIACSVPSGTTFYSRELWRTCWRRGVSTATAKSARKSPGNCGIRV